MFILKKSVKYENVAISQSFILIYRVLGRGIEDGVAIVSALNKI